MCTIKWYILFIGNLRIIRQKRLLFIITNYSTQLEIINVKMCNVPPILFVSFSFLSNDSNSALPLSQCFKKKYSILFKCIPIQ